jgi:hypothetical protein
MGEDGVAGIKELLRRGTEAGVVPPVEIVVVD